MTLPQAYELFEYWQSWPPEHELIAMLARAYTTWEPKKKGSKEAEQMASLLTAQMILQAAGGTKAVAMGMNGVIQEVTSTGIGAWPPTYH